MGYEQKKGKRSKPSNGPNVAPGGGRIPFNEMRFANIELTNEEKAEFAELYAEGRFSADVLDTWLAAGYAIGIKLADGGKTVQVTLSCDVDGYVNSGFRLVSRAGSAMRAIAVAEYKDTYLSPERDWGKAMYQRTGDEPDIA